MKISDLDTPAVVVDLDILEANLARAQAHADALGLRLRPHVKTHKLPRIAKMQMALGAVGIVGIRRTDHALSAWWVPTMKLYFPLATIAAYKALIELVTRPYFWDKTTHGLFDHVADPHPRSSGTALLAHPKLARLDP